MPQVAPIGILLCQLFEPLKRVSFCTWESGSVLMQMTMLSVYKDAPKAFGRLGELIALLRPIRQI